MAARVGVYVLNYDGRRFLDECFGALERQTYRDFDAILIDNASTDDSVDHVRGRYPWVQVLQFTSNLGFAAAYDRAIRASTHELCALLNNDTRADETWLEALVGTLDAGGPDVAACSSRIRFMNDPGRLNHAGGCATLVGSGFDIGFGEEDGPRFECRRETGVPSGAASLVRREAYCEVGGFDPAYVAYFEDVDLGWRFWLGGYRVLYEPSAVVYHHYGGSWGGRASARRVYYCQRNRLANMIVNLSWLTLPAALPVSIAHDLVRLALLLREGNREGILAMAGGSRDFLRGLSHQLRRRRRVQAARRRTDRELMQRGVIATLPASVLALRAAQRARSGGGG